VTPSAAPPALLVLEDGTTFRGRAFGAPGEAFGEAVFNTGMAGYQEVLTDPSYRRQIVAMTAPHVGNYGVNGEDAESDRVQVAAFAVREASRRAWSWRATGTLHGYLEDAGVVGIEGIDTRRLTRLLRTQGAMRAAVSTEDLDAASLVDRVGREPGMDGADLASAVSCPEPYEAKRVVGKVKMIDHRIFRVAAYDFGVKRNILRLLHAHGCETTVFPATTPAATVLAGGFDGVFLSNGPGDPAATTYGVDVCRRLLGRIPVFGICLGHQLMARALGANTYKLKFGHRGVNQPVIDLVTGRIEITTHNHGFAVAATGWGAPAPDHQGAPAPEVGEAPRGEPAVAPDDSRPSEPGERSGGVPDLREAGAVTPIAETKHGVVAIDRWNLNDGTVEGLTCRNIPAFSVQYHPEGAPGPHDARHLFERFRELMAGA
jgi:carbamoyl-phosphate synthase small subunit